MFSCLALVALKSVKAGKSEFPSVIITATFGTVTRSPLIVDPNRRVLMSYKAKSVRVWPAIDKKLFYIYA